MTILHKLHFGIPELAELATFELNGHKVLFQKSASSDSIRLAIVFLTILSVLFHPPMSFGQEIAFLDLTNVHARTELRYPRVPESECTVYHMCRFYSDSAAPGVVADEDKRALRTTLIWMDKAEYKHGDRAVFEATAENVGAVSIDLPWTPHLADLQPADDTAEFHAYSFGISIELRTPNGESTQIGHVILFGSADHHGTLLTLKSGDKVRIRAATTISGLGFSEKDRQRLLCSPSYQMAIANSWLRRESYSPRPGGLVVKSENIFPRRVIDGGVTVLVIPPDTINLNGVRLGASCHLAAKTIGGTSLFCSAARSWE